MTLHNVPAPHRKLHRARRVIMGTMTPAPQDTTPWEHLGERLAGSFAARARGLLAPELLLSSSGGEEFGRLRLDGTEGAHFEAGDARATIERGTASRHRMLDGGGKVLVEQTAGPADAPEGRCGGRLHQIGRAEGREKVSI